LPSALRDARNIIGPELLEMESNKEVVGLCQNTHIARRFQNLIDH